MAHAGSSLALGGLILAGAVLGDRATGRPEASAQATPTDGARVALAADPEPERDYATAYRDYVELLTRLLGGDGDARDSLLAAGAELCRFGRCDALDVARYYTDLTEEELRAGQRAERHYQAVWQDVRANAGLGGEEWDAWREELVRELREFVARVGAEADFVPAARALSLLARIDVDRVERDLRLALSDVDRLLAEAQADSQRSHELFERAGMLTPTLEPLWTLARVDRKRGNVTLARESYADLLQLATRVGNEAYREHALRGLLIFAQELGDVAEVEDLLQELLTCKTAHSGWFVARKHVHNLLYQDEPLAARDYLARNRPADAEAGGRARDLDEWHVLRAGTCLRLDDIAGARRAYEELAPGSLVRRTGLARVALREGRFQDALSDLDDDHVDRLDWDERALALTTRAEARLGTGDAHGAILAVEQALSAAETWRLLFESSRTDGADPVINVVGEVVGVHAVVLLARAHAELGNALEAARVIEELQSRSLAAGRAPLADRDGPGETWSRSIAAQDVLAWAREYELGLLTFAIGADASLVVHVAPDGDARAVPIEHGRRAVQQAVRRLREALVAGNLRRAEALANEVRAVLIPEVLAERLVPPSGAPARLLCLLHGPLEELPIEALAGGGALAAGLVPVVLPGLPDATPGAAPDRDALARWILLGDPVTAGDGAPAGPAGGAAAGGPAGGAARRAGAQPDGRADAWPGELPGARAELAELGRLLVGSRLHTAAGFDRAALEQALRGDRPLHVATHFVPRCDRRAERLRGAGLLLSHGDVFCPPDVLAQAPRLPLVVLSACESHAGERLDGQGLHGVARALLEGGTRNLLVTLWPVEDAAAREYALAFHRALAEEPLPSLAAARARDDLRRRGFQPADWAAFRLVGRD